MGQKVNPHGLRVGIIKDWNSKWYADKEFADYLVEDHKIRTFLKKKLYAAGVSKVEIERASDRVKVTVYTAKPGVVIGKGGAEIENLKKELDKKGIDKAACAAYSDGNPKQTQLSADEQAIVSALEGGERLVDDVIAETGLGTGRLLSSLTMLELRGVIRRLPGKRIVLNRR